jgi:feruloyl-CoA synthase
VAFAPVDVEARPLGSALVLRSRTPPAAPARCVGDWLVAHARAVPDATFLAERDAAGGWRRLSYGTAAADAIALGSALLGLGAGPTQPLLVLADNGIDHALVALAAMHVGIPVAPASTAYALRSRDFARLRAVAAQLDPGVIYVEDRGRYGPALDAIGPSVPVIAADDLPALASTAPSSSAQAAFAGLRPDAVAKILFTSGSTGSPKGVVNTHRMLTSNQAALAQVWPFLREAPPVVVDWLPWSHTFGGNHNFFLVLAHGGTMMVDGGRPSPEGLPTTLANLREVSPTIHFNVPRGWDLLVEALEADEGLCASFFRELRVAFYAAAALGPDTWARLSAVARRSGRGDLCTTSAWGATETAPLATAAHGAGMGVGNIGVPVPGVEVALAPVEGRTELRVRGPGVTPGYWRPGGAIESLTLDEHGFWCSGDAARLEDPADPGRGLRFDGRLGENFKLASGTWVSVGRLRLSLVEACAPGVEDLVVTGHGRAFVGVLVFPRGSLAPADLAARLRAHNRAHPGSSEQVRRALVLDTPPSLDAGETTDKGYLNQRRVLERRADAVERLHADPPGRDVIVL